MAPTGPKSARFKVPKVHKELMVLQQLLTFSLIKLLRNKVQISLLP